GRGAWGLGRDRTALPNRAPGRTRTSDPLLRSYPALNGVLTCGFASRQQAEVVHLSAVPALGWRGQHAVVPIRPLARCCEPRLVPNPGTLGLGSDSAHQAIGTTSPL